jgi:hypothetical protein
MSKGIMVADGAADSAAGAAAVADESGAGAAAAGGGASAGAAGWDLEQPATAKMAADATLKASVNLILGIHPPVAMPDLTISTF